MVAGFEVTIHLACDIESGKHDHVRGDGCAEFTDSTRKGAVQQAIDAGWVLPIEGPSGRRLAYCPECVRGLSSKSSGL